MVTSIFSFFQKCLQKTSYTGLLKVMIVWSRVEQGPMKMTVSENVYKNDVSS